MGIYSTNRVSFANESLDTLIEEMDWTPDYSIGSMMEAVIQIHENDAKMFDSLIECDFVSANNQFIMNEAEAEASNSSNDEKKKMKIGEKIHAIFEAVKSFIQKMAANFIAKVMDIVKSDKKICEQYEKVLTLDNLKNFEGIAGFNWVKAPITVDSLKNTENTKKFTSDFINKATNASDKETIDTAFEEFKNKVEKEEKEFSKLEEELFVKTPDGAKWKPTEKWQLSMMLYRVGNASDTIKEIKQAAAKTISELKLIQNNAKKASSSTSKKKEASEVEVYKMKKLYDVASQTTKLFSKEFAAYTRVASKQIAAYRKALILCGRAAAKAAKGESTSKNTEEVNNESAIMYVLGESSDAYVYECLGY